MYRYHADSLFTNVSRYSDIVTLVAMILSITDPSSRVTPTIVLYHGYINHTGADTKRAGVSGVEGWGARWSPFVYNVSKHCGILVLHSRRSITLYHHTRARGTTNEA